MELISVVKSLLRDGNTMVLTNAIHCLSSIEEKGGPKFTLDYTTVNKLLTALDEASEWGQVTILDAISIRFQPENNSQAERILDKIVSLIMSKNSGVVLSSIKVMMKMLYNLEDSNLIRDY